MQQLCTSSGDFLIGLESTETAAFSQPVTFREYAVFYVADGKGVFYSDFGAFPFEGPTLLFATPLQLISMKSKTVFPIRFLRFHGDFYCIEYHRKEVACNGLLFNNIYLEPSVVLTDREIGIIERIQDDIADELRQPEPAEMVLRAYLQLFLAKASQLKIKSLNNPIHAIPRDESMEQFKQLLEQHYLELRKPHEYASLLAMSPNTLTKRCRRYFKKSPSALIQERFILEAKKQLHLTRKSIKEIAWALKFEDEFYFSRVFKKFTNISPQAFRDQTGISIVADLSM
ncbi:helix-turn-helix domain-containing protein [Larkinella bovis]|uniref:Helix-turn-helix domain-containing protein n=1 Tax=Larkinella bovis TaxID=683041 RepID=A0ABW0IFC3_9BACT